jgi:hypothetical protein
LPAQRRAFPFRAVPNRPNPAAKGAESGTSAATTLDLARAALPREQSASVSFEKDPGVELESGRFVFSVLCYVIV